MPPEICTCTSTGTASMPEKAKVRTRAMVAAESSAVRARWPALLRECPALPEDGEGNGNAGPRRIAGPPYVTRVRATILLLALLAICIGGSTQAAPRRIRLARRRAQSTFRAYGLGLLPIDASFATLRRLAHLRPGRQGVVPGRAPRPGRQPGHRRPVGARHDHRPGFPGRRQLSGARPMPGACAPRRSRRDARDARGHPAIRAVAGLDAGRCRGGGPAGPRRVGHDGAATARRPDGAHPGRGPPGHGAGAGQPSRIGALTRRAGSPIICIRMSSATDTLADFTVEDHVGFLLRRAHQRHVALFTAGDGACRADADPVHRAVEDGASWGGSRRTSWDGWRRWTRRRSRAWCGG